MFTKGIFLEPVDGIYSDWIWIYSDFKFKKLQYVYFWFSSPDHVRVTDEAWIAETSKYGTL